MRAGGTQRETGVDDAVGVMVRRMQLTLSDSCAYSRPSKSVRGASSTGFQ